LTQLAVDVGVISQREFRIGSAISKSVEVFSRNFAPFSLLSLAVWLPIGVIQFATLGMKAQQRDLWAGGASLIFGFLQLVLVAAIIHATFQDMRGQPVRMGESIGRGLKRFFPLIGAGILLALGVFLGIVLLIVPGLILFARWYVFASVCVVEKQGPLGSLKRSAELTKGNRWKLFGIWVILFAIGAASGALIAVLFLQVSPIAAIVARGLWQVVWSTFNNVLSVVIYHDLRVAKEGVDIESIASVFD
jgi:hypothetical protein